MRKTGKSVAALVAVVVILAATGCTGFGRPAVSEARMELDLASGRTLTYWGESPHLMQGALVVRYGVNRDADDIWRLLVESPEAYVIADPWAQYLLVRDERETGRTVEMSLGNPWAPDTTTLWYGTNVSAEITWMESVRQVKVTVKRPASLDGRWTTLEVIPHEGFTELRHTSFWMLHPRKVFEPDMSKAASQLGAMIDSLPEAPEPEGVETSRAEIENGSTV